MNEKTNKTAGEASTILARPLKIKVLDIRPEFMEDIGDKDIIIYRNNTSQLCESWFTSKKILIAVFRLSKAYNGQTCVGRLDIRLSLKDQQRLQDLKNKIEKEYPDHSIKKIDADQISEQELVQYGMVILDNGKNLVISSVDDKVLKLMLEALEKNRGWSLIKGIVEMPLSYPKEDWKKIKETLGKIRIQKTSTTT